MQQAGQAYEGQAEDFFRMEQLLEPVHLILLLFVISTSKEMNTWSLCWGKGANFENHPQLCKVDN